MWKNWLLWKRNLFCSILEILLPGLMCCFFYIFRFTTDYTKYGQKSYLEPNYAKKVNYPYTLFSDFEYPNNVPLDIRPSDDHYKDSMRGYYPFLQNCVNRKLGDINKKLERNGRVALAPKGNKFVDKIAEYIEKYEWAG